MPPFSPLGQARQRSGKSAEAALKPAGVCLGRELLTYHWQVKELKRYGMEMPLMARLARIDSFYDDSNRREG